MLGPYHIPLPDEPIDTERVVELWDGTGHLLLAKDFTYSQLRTPATTAHPLHANGTDFVPGSIINFREIAGSLDTSIHLSELREGDRYSKVDTPVGCDWRILVISHPLPET